MSSSTAPITYFSGPNRMLDINMNSFGLSHLLVVLIVVSLTLTPILYERRRRGLRIPNVPGPRGLPFVGNLYDIRTNAAEQYRKWSHQYGDVFQIQLGDITVLVVNSASAAKAIFLGHSNALSSRPVFFTFHKIIAKIAGVTMGTAPMTKSLNRSRKDTPLGKPAVSTYVKYLDVETRDFLRQCLAAVQRPIDPLRMLQRMSLSLDLTLCWGRRIALEDPLLVEIAQVEHEIVNLRNPMTNLQDCIPALRFPWSKTTKNALELRQRRDTYFAQLNNDLDQRLQKGEQMSCIRAELLHRPDVDNEELNLICLTFISAGMAPTVATLQWSLALLARRLDIQQAALDAIQEHYKGNTVLGDVDDDQGCQYVVALAKECLRYFTVARTSLPRSTVKDFHYDGNIIPTGTTVFLNAWACNMDPALWPNDAHIFKPERWIEKPDAPLFTYGLGYRSCTGISLASRLLYIFFVRLIVAFEISVGSDVDVHHVSGCKSAEDLVSSPNRYTVVFKPRDEERLTQALR